MNKKRGRPIRLPIVMSASWIGATFTERTKLHTVRSIPPRSGRWGGGWHELLPPPHRTSRLQPSCQMTLIISVTVICNGKL